jgi:hypothetical protein
VDFYLHPSKYSHRHSINLDFAKVKQDFQQYLCGAAISRYLVLMILNFFFYIFLVSDVTVVSILIVSVVIMYFFIQCCFFLSEYFVPHPV